MPEQRPQLEITETRRRIDRGDALILRFEGDLDLAAAGKLTTALQAGRWQECAAAVLDLLEVPFIDSSGLRDLLVAAKSLAEEDRGFGVVVADDSEVRRLIDLAEIRDRLPLYETVDLALEDLDRTGRNHGTES